MERQEHPRPAPGRRERVFAGTGVPWGLVALVIVAAALILFVVQNTESVRAEWAMWEFETSLAAVVLVAMVAAVLLTSLVGLVWRRSRRRILTERERARRLEEEVSSLRAPHDRPVEAPSDGVEQGREAHEARPSPTPSESSPSEGSRAETARDDP